MNMNEGITNGKAPVLSLCLLPELLHVCLKICLKLLCCFPKATRPHFSVMLPCFFKIWKNLHFMDRFPVQKTSTRVTERRLLTCCLVLKGCDTGRSQKV